MRRRLLVTTSTYPRWEGDTHPRFVHDLCARLVARHDVEVTVLAPTSHGAERNEIVDGVHIERFAYWRDRPDLLRDGPALPTLKAHPTTALQVPTYLAALALAMRRQLRDHGPWDAVHAHWLLPQATVAAAVLGRRGGQPGRPRLVGTSHGSDVLGTGRAGEPALRWTLRRLDSVTAVSAAVADRIRELAAPTSTTIHVAPMGIDTDRFRPSPAARAAKRNELGLSADQPLVLSAGRLVRGKGVDLLLEALPRVAATHPDVHVAVVGHGTAEADLRTQVQQLHLGDRVTFHGFAPHDELARWYAAADVLVSPSRSEGFGLVSVEALASGCPVIASELPALRDVASATTALLTVPVDDAAELARRLADHLGRREELRAMAVTQAPKVAERFGWDGAAAAHANVLFG